MKALDKSAVLILRGETLRDRSARVRRGTRESGKEQAVGLPRAAGGG